MLTRKGTDKAEIFFFLYGLAHSNAKGYAQVCEHVPGGMHMYVSMYMKTRKTKAQQKY